jgi:hypothetical protein
MVQGEATRLENFKELLDEFGQLRDRVERPRTFMEIAGYPHYENVCSNILAFFMDPEGPHGFGTLVLDALVSAGNIAAANEGLGGGVSVEREVVTSRDNRIDILIESDNRAVLIENKIYALLNNPFADYKDYLDRRIRDGRAKHKLLLTVFPTNDGKNSDFENLTYAKFVEEIRSLLGSYISNADARYLTIFLDFLNTLENLRKGSRMDQKFVEFLAKRNKDIERLFNDLKSLRADLRTKVEELRDLIDTSQYRSVEVKDVWRGDIVSMSDNLYFIIRTAEDLLVGIDAKVSPNGWEIQLFARDKGDPSKLRDLLESLEIPFKEKERFVHPADFGYNANPDQIRPVLQNVVDKLATVREHQK